MGNETSIYRQKIKIDFNLKYINQTNHKYATIILILLSVFVNIELFGNEISPSTSGEHNQVQGATNDSENEVSIVINKNSPMEVFGASKIETVLAGLNLTPLLVDKSLATGQEDIQINIIGQDEDPEIMKEGFRIGKAGGAYMITSIDNSGAMYGLMDLTEQIEMQKGLSNIEEKLVNPRFNFRAIKFNLPWSSYRRNESLQANEEICKDLEFWESFLDMMAENCFNVLTLWNLHPWPYMIQPTNFPLAAQGNDQEMAQWKVFWTSLFQMAKDRGIETYILNWNVFVSKGFEDNYDNSGQVDNGSYIGDISDTEIVRRYNRECITQVINEYPDLTGLGVTLGERMQNLNSEQQTDWVKSVFFDGIKAADRKVKFIYRAALKGDHTVHRACIDSSGLDTPEDPIIVELKFNWSHAYSTTTLIKAHGGGTGEEYWTNPAPSHHKMAWMIRNEDFFRLRWGEPDFIREHIQSNGQDFVGGYFIGSECYIPAKDLFHMQGHNHRNWKYAFERQWLYYKEWGRLLYDPTTTDAVFANAYNNKYSGNIGDQMIEAYKLSTRATQKIAGFFDFTWDYTFYTEGFLKGSGFISVQDVIDAGTIEPNFVGVKEYSDGEGDYGTRISPLELATTLENDANEALNIVNSISTTDNTLLCEMDDVKAWSQLGLFFAKKIRAAVAVNQNNKTEAVISITEAQNYWKNLVTITQAHIQESHLGMLNGDFHWKNYQDEVDDDVSWIKNINAITSPANGETFPEHANVLVNVSAPTNNNSIDSVEFRTNGVLLETDYDFPFTSSLNDLSIGTYAIEVRVYDSYGGIDTNLVNIAVEDPSTFNTVPWLEDFTLADGTKTDYGITSWTATRGTGLFEIRQNSLIINDNGDEGVFNTGVINISDGPVNVSLDVKSEGVLDLGQDYVKFFKKVDGGN